MNLKAANDTALQEDLTGKISGSPGYLKGEGSLETVTDFAIAASRDQNVQRTDEVNLPASKYSDCTQEEINEAADKVQAAEEALDE